MIQQTTHEEVVLAALLHDIGKMVERLNRRNPFDEGQEYGWSHARETHEFLKEGGNLNIRGVPGIEWSRVAVLAAKHHRPDDRDTGQKIIQQADWLSAGMDRGDEFFKDDIRLSSLFSDKRIPFVPLDDFSSSIPIFPSEKEDDFSALQNMLSEHASHLSNILSGSKNARFVIDCVSWFCKRFLYCTPSDRRHAPKMSLYDHSLTTAAIASSLFVNQRDGSSGFHLIAGGVDGIQRFVSGASGTKKAAKGLRGRSFFLQMLVEWVVHRLLNEFGLHSPSCVMQAAGKFWILAPGGSEVRRQVEEISEIIERYLAEILYYDVKFPIVAMPCKESDLMHGEPFAKTVEILGELLRDKELHPFSQILSDRFMSKPGHESVGKDSCISCSQRVKDGEDFCELCERMKSLGEALTGADYLVWVDEITSDMSWAGMFPSAPYPSLEKGTSPEDLKNLPGLVALATLKFESNRDTPGRIILPHRILGRHIPDSTIEEIGKGRYVGALKLDVDNLGDLWRKNGLSCLGAAATFSRIFDFFFSDYVQWRLERDYPNDIYTVFSGGDDMFLIGDLKSISMFAFELEERFRSYADNPDVHFSAGLTVHHRKFPVRHIIEAAEDELARAKSTKDSLSFQGHSLSWKEARGWYGRWRQIDEKDWMGEKSPISRALWRRILKSYEEMRRTKSGKAEITELNDYLYDAHIKYCAARILPSGDADPPEVKRLRKELLEGSSEEYLPVYYNAVRLATWLAREKEGR